MSDAENTSDSDVVAKGNVWPASHDEMRSLIDNFDWSATPLGPMENWSPTLKIMIPFLLRNRFPLLLWWGPQYVSIYNEAYRPVLGAKHPWALGKPVSECWSEIWHVLKPLIDTPFHGGPATWNDDIELEINRHGFLEETHFTIAYSPVPDETAENGIGGVLATVTEITRSASAVSSSFGILLLARAMHDRPTRPVRSQRKHSRSTNETCPSRFSTSWSPAANAQGFPDWQALNRITRSARKG